LLLIVTILFAYLLGSVPTSVWLGRGLKGIDLREHGSGNAGATNAFRVLGTPIGIAVYMLDMLKGYAAVNLSHLQTTIHSGSEAWMILRIGLGLLAVAGHIFPVFAGFRGGKGVSTLAGIGLALHPLSAACALGIYALVFLIGRVSSLGSLAAVLSYPIWMILVFHSEFRALWVFSILVPILVIITHRSNIRRLLQKEEGSLLRRS
jgi:glycerol-3-phosphate acyltransferase PlsY